MMTAPDAGKLVVDPTERVVEPEVMLDVKDVLAPLVARMRLSCDSTAPGNLTVAGVSCALTEEGVAISRRENRRVKMYVLFIVLKPLYVIES
jgi:hypothetical protein